MKKSYAIYFLCLLPITNYNLIALSSLLLIFIIDGLNRIVLFNFIIFLFLALVFYLIDNNVTHFKYIISIVVILFLLNIKNSIDINIFKNTTIVLTIFALIESSNFRDSLRFFYRSSNLDLHYERFSCLFLFPGDLGAYASIAISTHMLYQLTNNTKKFFENSIFIILNFILLILSQSRMGFSHLIISIFILMILKPKYIYLSLFFIPIYIYFKDSLDYLFKDDLIDLLFSFFNSDSESSNKRSQEVFETLGKSNLDSEYFEGSIPSLIYRFGYLLSVPIVFYMLFSFIQFLKKTNNIKFSAIVFLPLIITSFISAPFERPKLLLFSFSSLIISVNLLVNYSQKKKIDEKIHSLF